MIKKLPPTLSSGLAAKIMQVSTRSVTKWIDFGTLKGYRINKCRRITRQELLKFMNENNLPIDFLLKTSGYQR